MEKAIEGLNNEKMYLTKKLTEMNGSFSMIHTITVRLKEIDQMIKVLLTKEKYGKISQKY